MRLAEILVCQGVERGSAGLWRGRRLIEHGEHLVAIMHGPAGEINQCRIVGVFGELAR